MELITIIDNFLDSIIGNDWYRAVFYHSGNGDIHPGDIITGESSGYTAVVQKVVLISGSWDDGTASGYLLINSALYEFYESETMYSDNGRAIAISKCIAVSEGSGYIQFDGSTFADSAYLQLSYSPERQFLIECDLEMPTGYQASDGSGAYIMIELYNNDDDYLRFGMKRDDSNNAIAYLENCVDGTINSNVLDDTDLDALSHTYRILIAENTIEMYLAGVLCGEVPLNNLTKYNVRIFAGTEGYEDTITAKCTRFVAMNYIPAHLLVT